MSKVFVGNVTSEGDRLIHLYLDKFMPDAVIEPLRASGIRTKMKMQAKRPDVALIIIDEALYQTCEGVAGDVLKLPKVYKYADDAGLKLFLESKFGKMDIEPTQPAQAVENHVEPEVTSVPSFEPVVESSAVAGDDMDFGYGGVFTNYTDNVEVESLKRELEQNQLLVKSLTQQLQEKGRSSDTSSLVGRIRELDTQLKERDSKIREMETESYTQLGKVAKAEEAIKKLAVTEKELAQQRELLRQAESKKAELNADIAGLRQRISELDKFPKLYEDTQRRLAELDDKYKKTYVQFESKCDEYDVLLQRTQNAERGSVSDRKQIESLSKQITDLQAQLENQAKEKSGIEGQLTEYKSKVESLTYQIQGLNKQLAEMTKRATDAEVKSVSLDAKVKESADELKMALDEAESLEKQLKESQEKVSELQRKADTSQGVADELDEVKNSLLLERERSEGLEKKLNDVSDRLIKAQDNVSSLTSELETRDSVIKDLKERVSTLSSETDGFAELNKKLARVQEDLIHANDELSAKSKEYDTLLKEKEIIESESVKEQLDLKNQLSDREREIKNLESEIELLKRGVDESGKTADLRMKILSLQEEVQELKKHQDASDSAELLKLREEITKMRQRCAELETDVQDKDEVLNELYSNIFIHMADCAVPKLKVDVKLPMPSSPLEKCIVVGGGSAESNTYIYKVLKNTCMAGKSRKTIIIELVTDSYIDSEFKLKSIKTPLPWLQGQEPLTNFASDTCFGNVKVISPALAYFNPLYLLTVDWQARLEELRKLQKSVDLIIINVGVLNNIVSKVLFQSFAEVMKSHVVVRATPINIRTVLLCLAGLPNSNKAEISCVHYDVASKNMYQKLATTYQARILHDNEGLGV